MTGPELKLLPDFRDEDGIPRFGIPRWHAQDAEFQSRNVSISGDELREQLSTPVRIADEPSYWLFRGRVVKEEGARSQPDDVVDALEELSAADMSYAGLARVTAARLARPLWFDNYDDLVSVYKSAVEGRLPRRHSSLVRDRPLELALRVKHVVFTEEREFERLRREVEAFENFEQLSVTPRTSIPEHVQMFVWQRDQGRCAKCGSQERLEFDHIIPLARGGSNTERNIQLLCELCNRRKGANVPSPSSGHLGTRE